MASIEPKKRASKPTGLAGWYPADPKFREHFNAALAAALKHVEKHGDTSAVTKLLERVEPPELRKRILRRLVRLRPLEFNIQTGRLGQKKPYAPFNWDEAPRIDAFEGWSSFHNDTIHIGKSEFTTAEFVDEVIDALVLARNAISDEGISRLSEAISQISDHHAKKRDRG